MGASARPGPWRTESYQQEMMNAVHEADARSVVFMTSTQIGKSEILNNIVGFHIDLNPKPMMMVQPTDLTAKSFSKKRITPMVDNSPALKGKVREATTRRPGNEIRLKEFPGGFLKLSGANSASGLRTDPIALLLFDEVDGYPEDVDGEGNPVEIATRRLDTFWRALTLMASTPGKPKGLSRIEHEWERSDQRLYHVPCPHCNYLQPFYWRDPAGVHRLRWEKDAEGQPLPDSVHYLCAKCKRGIQERFKREMLTGGRWIAKHPDRRGIIGFKLNALYSPWQNNWHHLAKEWVDAKDNLEKLRVFVNLRLAETWDEGADTSVTPHELRLRTETYPSELPEQVCVLVATADLQHNRIEAQVTGFGAGEESWLIAHEIFWGNPGLGVDPETDVNVWEQLDDFRLKAWKHASGVELLPALTFVDAGAHADSVYNFVAPRQATHRPAFACKGVEHLSKPGLVAESISKRMRHRLFLIGTYAAKDRIFARLKIPTPGPGYHHLPDWVTDEYLEQLMGEVKITRRVRRTRGVRREYVKTAAHNEALDLTVYAHAGLAALQQILAPAIYRDLNSLSEAVRKGQAPESLQVRRGRRLRSRPVL